MPNSELIFAEFYFSKIHLILVLKYDQLLSFEKLNNSSW